MCLPNTTAICNNQDDIGKSELLQSNVEDTKKRPVKARADLLIVSTYPCNFFAPHKSHEADALPGVHCAGELAARMQLAAVLISSSQIELRYYGCASQYHFECPYNSVSTERADTGSTGVFLTILRSRPNSLPRVEHA